MAAKLAGLGLIPGGAVKDMEIYKIKFMRLPGTRFPNLLTCICGTLGYPGPQTEVNKAQGTS